MTTRRFHINPAGNVGECSADEGKCPFQGVHYPDYDTAVDAAENMFAEQYGYFPGGGAKPEVDVLTEFRLDGETYENAMIHLGAIADTLEWNDPNNPEWVELREKIQYVPSELGPLSQFDPVRNKEPLGNDWPSELYAQLLYDGEISRDDLLRGARALNQRADELSPAED